MSTIYEQLVARVEQIGANCIHSAVLENKPLYEVFNAITGTTFDEASFEAATTENLELLNSIIPGGSKTLIVTPDDAVGAPVIDDGEDATVNLEIPTADEVAEHIGSTLQVDVNKYDLDQDGDIDQDDVDAADRKSVV